MFINVKEYNPYEANLLENLERYNRWKRLGRGRPLGNIQFIDNLEKNYI